MVSLGQSLIRPNKILMINQATFFTVISFTNRFKPDYSVHAQPDDCLRLMPLGGSITYGVGSSDGNGYRESLTRILLSHGYRVRMVGSRKSGTMANNDNEGWRGYRLDQIQAKVEKCATVLSPEVFLINAGSNDCIQDLRLKDFGRRMDELLEYLWKTCPSSTIILSTLLVNADKDVNSRVSHVNEQIRDLVKLNIADGKKIVVADMQGTEGPRLIDLVDGTHPGDVGYGMMAVIWFNSIQEAKSRGILS